MARWSSCLLALIACSETLESHDLTIDVRTDLSPGIDFDSAEVAEGTRVLRIQTAMVGIDASAWRVLEATSFAAGRHEMRVRLLRGASTVAERSVSFDLEGDLSVTVVISRQCRGVVCGGGQACIDGRCGAADCVTGTESTCFADVCVSDAMCGRTACASSSCELGVCLGSSDVTDCAPSEYCDHEIGCRPRPSFDAGVVDAGPGFDAGPPDPPDDSHLGEPEWVPIDVVWRTECEPLMLCSASPEGIWDVTGGCLKLGIDSMIDLCPGYSLDVSGEARGRLRAGPLRAFATLEYRVEGTLVWPSICELGVPCSEIPTRLAGTLEQVECTGSSGCTCTGVLAETGMDSGMYTFDNGTLRVEGGRTFEMCAEGTARIRDVDENSTTFFATRQPPS